MVGQVAAIIVIELTVNVAGLPAADDVSRGVGAPASGVDGVVVAFEVLFDAESAETLPVT